MVLAIATLLYCYPLHDYYTTMLLCCYVGDCSTMQGLVMALFIDWPERDWSFVFYNITSHHIDWAKYKSGEVQAVRDKTMQSSDFQHFPQISKNICLLIYIQSRQQSRQMWCTVGAQSAGTNTQRNTLNSAGWSYIAIFACLVVLDDWLIGMMTKECYRW